MKRIIEYQGFRNGIRVLRQEDSYTSRANFLGKDVIPVYDKNIREQEYAFTGRRVHRGLYQTNDGKIINADINGSFNILRKCILQAVEGMVRNRNIQKQAIPMKPDMGDVNPQEFVRTPLKPREIA